MSLTYAQIAAIATALRNVNPADQQLSTSALPGAPVQWRLTVLAIANALERVDRRAKASKFNRAVFLKSMRDPLLEHVPPSTESPA